MTEKNWRQKLEQEGFAGIYVQVDAPGAHYPPHRHGKLTAHIILEGEMSIRMARTRTKDFKEFILKENDRVDVPAGQIHEARMGPRGCRYLAGEKS